MRIFAFLCTAAFFGLLSAEPTVAAPVVVTGPVPAKNEPAAPEKPATPAPAAPAKSAPDTASSSAAASPAQYSLNFVQYEVSAVPCVAENAMMDTITKKAGYACAVQKGRIAINLTGTESRTVTDFMNKQITVAIEGKKDNYLLVRVKIPGEMDAVFMPVIGGSFVAGYDLDAKKSKGVLLLIYVV